MFQITVRTSSCFTASSNPAVERAAAAGVDDNNRQDSAAGTTRELASPAVSSSSGGTMALEVTITSLLYRARSSNERPYDT